MNERHHPRLGRYEHEHTKRRSARVDGGARAVQLPKLVSALNVVPVNAGVIIPFVRESISDGEFRGSDLQLDAARTMLDAPKRTEAALRALRALREAPTVG